MSTNGIAPKSATTIISLLKTNTEESLVNVEILTGRTHQIRVHLTSIGHPVLGDTTYGKTCELIARQALHAHRLCFKFHGKEYSLQASIPSDISELIKAKNLEI